jgi:hypothetical protein
MDCLLINKERSGLVWWLETVFQDPVGLVSPIEACIACFRKKQIEYDIIWALNAFQSIIYRIKAKYFKHQKELVKKLKSNYCPFVPGPSECSTIVFGSFGQSVILPKLIVYYNTQAVSTKKGYLLLIDMIQALNVMIADQEGYRRV